MPHGPKKGAQKRVTRKNGATQNDEKIKPWGHRQAAGTTSAFAVGEAAVDELFLKNVVVVVVVVVVVFWFPVELILNFWL